MPFHGRLTRHIPIPKTSDRGDSHGTRGDIELLLEVLDISPEGQVLFAEVAT